MMGRTLVTPIFRAAFVALLEPKQSENGFWSYSLTAIFEPDDIKPLVDLFDETVKEIWKGSPPRTGVTSPFRKGEWKSGL